MSVEIIPPSRRTCERCGRIDVWDDDAENWVIAEEDGQRRVGNRHCIHEWDINGRYNPIDGQMEGGAAAGGGAPAGAGSGGDGVEADADEGHDA